MTNVIQLKSNLLSSSAFSPSIYVKDITSKINSVKGIPTSFTAFVGLTKKGPINKPTQINSFYEFKRSFGELYLHHNLGYAVRHFFSNGGINAIIVSVGTEDNILPEKIIGQKNNHTGIYSLDGAKNFNILCIPPYDETETTDIEVYRKAFSLLQRKKSNVDC